MTWDRNEDFFAWEARRHLALLGREVDVLVAAEPEAGGPTTRQLELLARVEGLPRSFADALAPALLEYAADVAEYLGKPVGVDAGNVLATVDVSTLAIPPLGPTDRAVFVLWGECAWEREHGLSVWIDLDAQRVLCGDEQAFGWQWDGSNGATDWDLWSDKGRAWAKAQGRW